MQDNCKNTFAKSHGVWPGRWRTGPGLTVNRNWRCTPIETSTTAHFLYHSPTSSRAVEEYATRWCDTTFMFPMVQPSHNGKEERR